MLAWMVLLLEYKHIWVILKKPISSWHCRFKNLPLVSSWNLRYFHHIYWHIPNVLYSEPLSLYSINSCIYGFDIGTQAQMDDIQDMHAPMGLCTRALVLNQTLYLHMQIGSFIITLELQCCMDNFNIWFPVYMVKGTYLQISHIVVIILDTPLQNPL